MSPPEESRKRRSIWLLVLPPLSMMTALRSSSFTLIGRTYFDQNGAARFQISRRRRRVNVGSIVSLLPFPKSGCFSMLLLLRLWGKPGSFLSTRGEGFLIPKLNMKTRGMGAARKLKSHRRTQRSADKSYKKSHLGNEWKKPFAGSSHAKGIVLEKIGIEAKQPNSAIRKCARVQLIKKNRCFYSK
ncbi:40S ribosomal protein S23 [Euphorbia peplus]|nr:40S ribosomal protein S23 [Euphorbia peplus]